jgi:hypothetical protein
MSDDPKRDAHRLPDEDDELGPPIEALRTHVTDPGPTTNVFLGRIERRIERRRVAGDLSRLWWEAPSHACLEIFKAIFEPRQPPTVRLPDPDPEEPNPHG